MTQPLSAKRSESEPGPVSLRFRFDSETVEQFAERYATDVSRGGIFVQSRQPFAVGTQLRLDLQLLNGTPIIVGEGTVHWTREPDPAKPHTVPGMGIRFSKLNARSQQIIEAVLSQRTGKQRTGLFSAVMPAVSMEESAKILNNSSSGPNPKSKLPFNVFPGRPHDPNKPNEDRELLANAGREEATPVVGVTAAHLADARPGKDEAASVKTPPPAAPLPEVGSGPGSASGGTKRPPLSLIRPEAGAPAKEADKAITESARVRRSSSSSKAAPLPPPPVTTTQEIPPSSGSTPPAPVQGEPALGASQSGVPMPIDAAPSRAARSPSAQPAMRNKLIMGAAALLAVSLTVFAVTRSGSKLDATPPVARVTATSTAPAQPTEQPAPVAAVPSATGTAPTGTAPTETAPEANTAPAAEPEAPSAPSSTGSHSSSSSRVADRRAPKGKTVVAHRDSQPASHSSSSSPAPVEKAPVAEVPAPRVEAPAPTLAPPPPPPPVAHIEPLLTPKPVHTEPPAAPKPAPIAAAQAPKPAPATSPPPVSGGLAHKLRMTSIPSEAEVELDGKSIGRTPLFGVEIDVSQPHQLVVKKDGFAPFKQTISRGSEWNVRPSENTATLRISALMKKQ